MKISTKSRYAVMAMAEMALGDSDSALSLGDIAARQHLPLPYLEQLFAKLRRAGLVESVRGAHGGYKLAKPLENIAVLDIMSAVDNPIKTTRCKSESHDGCQHGGARCVAHDLWAELELVLRNFLRHVTLLDFKRGTIPGLGYLFCPPEKKRDDLGEGKRVSIS